MGFEDHAVILPLVVMIIIVLLKSLLELFGNHDITKKQ